MNYNITPNQIYDFLNSNDKILIIYKKIENKEKLDGGWTFHNYEHIKNVTSIAEKILRDLQILFINTSYLLILLLMVELSLKK